MPFRLREATSADLQGIVDVWDASFANSSALDRGAFAHTPGVRRWYADSYVEEFNDPSNRFLVVVATPPDVPSSDKTDGNGAGSSTGGDGVGRGEGQSAGLVAVAGAGASAGVVSDASPGADEVVVAYGKWYVPVRNADGSYFVGGARVEDIEAAEWPAEYPADLCVRVFSAFARARERVMGVGTGNGKEKGEQQGSRELRPHYYLERVGVRPEARGTGAARKIIEWGTVRADEQKLEAYVEAHGGVVKLYEKHGFRVADSYTCEEIGHTETFMLRSPL